MTEPAQLSLSEDENYAVSAPPVLYKYFAPVSYVENVIHGRGIQFTTPARFNDPFECRHRAVYPGTRQQLIAYFERVGERVMPTTSKRERKAYAVRMTDRIQRGQAVLPHEFASFEQITASWGILCLTAHRHSLLMWAHYAREHTGICIGFDTDVDMFTVAMPVFYLDDIPEANYFDRSNVSKIADAAIFTKATCWAYENEWRLFKRTLSGPEKAEETIRQPSEELRRIFADQDGPGLYSFNKAAIVEVVLGVRTSPEYEASVRAWMLEAGLTARLLRAVLVRDKYCLTFIDED
jgi:hypothetical protein